jgi:hypothetical protein
MIEADRYAGITRLDGHAPVLARFKNGKAPAASIEESGLTSRLSPLARGQL